MALPALIKTYEFDLNNAIAGDSTQVGGIIDGTNDRKSLLLGIKNALIDGATFTVPWTVVGSSNASAAGLDGVDRWNTIADLAWVLGTDSSPASAAHSWIVLAHAALGVELLLACQNTSSGDGASLCAYLSVTGFTGGSATARPTASDEAMLRDGSSTTSGSWSGSALGSARNWKWHVMASDDGEVWNVLIYLSNILMGFWRFEVPTNPPGNWLSPVVAMILGANLESVHADDDAFTGTSGGSFVLGMESDRRQVDCGGVIALSWGWNGGVGYQTLNSLPATGAPLLWPIWWFAESDAMRGRLGQATDLWHVQSTVGGSVGDTYPSNAATPQFLVLSGTLGGFIVPWDGSTAPETA